MRNAHVAFMGSGSCICFIFDGLGDYEKVVAHDPEPWWVWLFQNMSKGSTFILRFLCQIKGSWFKVGDLYPMTVSFLLIHDSCATEHPGPRHSFFIMGMQVAGVVFTTENLTETFDKLKHANRHPWHTIHSWQQACCLIRAATRHVPQWVSSIGYLSARLPGRICHYDVITIFLTSFI